MARAATPSRTSRRHLPAVDSLINFAAVNHPNLKVEAGETVTNDEVMHLSLNADVVVVGKRTFTNLADVENPAENLVGIAQSASQGAITAQQLDVRPFMRQGEVLETVPGVIITQHSGEGKANQYFLRGFNLDHGSDFAMTVAGTPVNMPTHAHSQGYSDINFLIPELVAGVQYLEGPVLRRPGRLRHGRRRQHQLRDRARPAVRARSRAGPTDFGAAAGRGLAEDRHGAPARGVRDVDELRTLDRSRTPTGKYNGVLRYSQGDNVNGLSLTSWATTASGTRPKRRRNARSTAGSIDRFGSIDPTDGGHTYRYSVGGEWQRGTGNTLRRSRPTASATTST